MCGPSVTPLFSAEMVGCALPVFTLFPWWYFVSEYWLRWLQHKSLLFHIHSHRVECKKKPKQNKHRKEYILWWNVEDWILDQSARAQYSWLLNYQSAADSCTLTSCNFRQSFIIILRNFQCLLLRMVIQKSVKKRTYFGISSSAFVCLWLFSRSIFTWVHFKKSTLNDEL